MAKQICFCNSEKTKKSYAYISPVETIGVKKTNVVNYISSLIFNQNEQLLNDHYGNHESNIATYRCSIIYQNDEEREMMYDKYPKLEKHLKSIDRLNGDSFKENYLGCCRCIDTNESFLFTYLSNGWKNNINDQYENAHIIDFPPDDLDIQD